MKSLIGKIVGLGIAVMLVAGVFTSEQVYGQAKDTAAKVTKGTETGEVKELVWHSEANALKVTYFAMQELDNGYTRFRVKYSGVPKRNILIFDPPDGDLLRLTAKAKKSGAGVLSFDIKNSKLKKLEGLTVNFYAEDKADFVWIGLKDQAEEVNQAEEDKVNQGDEVLVADDPTSPPTEGKPVGKKRALNYGYDKRYFSKISVTEQKLDNGYLRYEVSYKTKNCTVTAVRGESYGTVDYYYGNSKLQSGDGYCIIDMKESYLKKDKKGSTGTCLGLYAVNKGGELVEMHFVPGDYTK